jgi:hypothetical protein
MASSSSQSFSNKSHKKILDGIFEEMINQKQKDDKTILELKKFVNDIHIRTLERDGVIRKLGMMESTSAGFGGILFLQDSEKKDLEVVQKLIDLKKDVEAQMVVKLEYISKA